MRYIEGAIREQSMLFPESLEDYVSEDNPVRYINAFVDSLNLSQFGFTHSQTAKTGRKPYNPADLLKLYLHGYLNRTRSSRRLEKSTYSNVEVIWLMRKLHPDHKTIADFRRLNQTALKKVCREFTLLCKSMGLFGCELVFIDGSKFSADNHNSRCYTQKKLQKLLKNINEQIEKYFETLEQQDQSEQHVSMPTSKELGYKISQLEQKRAELEQLQQQLETSEEPQISLTDPDSRLMKNKNGYDMSYNVQIAVDDKHKLIADFEATNDSNDLNQLSNMALKAKETLGANQLKVGADTGYDNDHEIVKCEKENIICYIPSKQNSQNAKKGLYTNDDFSYDAENNCYICPANQKLTYRFQAYKSGRQVKIYEGITCKSCSERQKCTTAKRGGRRIYRWVHEEIIEQHRQRVKDNPEIIARRKAVVEHPFGTIKHWMEHRYFLTRGLKSVNAEMSLSVLTYNMKRVLNIMTVKELIGILRMKAQFYSILECKPLKLNMKSLFFPSPGNNESIIFDKYYQNLKFNLFSFSKFSFPLTKLAFCH